MPILRPLLSAVAALGLLGPAQAGPAARLVPVETAPVAARQQALEDSLSSLERMVAAFAAADDAALTAAILATLRALAEAAGDRCVLHLESLDDDDEVLQMARLLAQALGAEGAVTPEVATLFTSAGRVRDMINTLKDQAGSLPGTADWLARIDAVKAGWEVLDDRLGAAMQAELDAGRISVKDEAMRLGGDGCPP